MAPSRHQRRPFVETALEMRGANEVAPPGYLRPAPPCRCDPRKRGRRGGYTDMVHDFSVIHPLLCAGAAAVTDPGIPAWQRATGVLVLVHESYHLRHGTGRYSEAKVECQAIRHFRQGAQFLGASRELANDLLPYGLAAHDRMVRLYPNYRDRACKLPLWTLPVQP